MENLKEYNIEEIMRKQVALDKFAKSVGVEIVSILPGNAKLKIDINERHINPGNSVHGGCIFTLADTAGGYAAWSRGDYVVTVSSNINFLNPAINTKQLIGIAREVKYGKRVSVYDIEIWDNTHKLIAKGTNTYYKLN